MAKTLYNPRVFEVGSERDARNIILTPEAGSTTDERWEKETPFIADDLARFLAPTQNSVVLDYGCGLGRLAKELVLRCECRVLGVDLSMSMRQLAPGYVLDDRFSVVSVPVFESLVRSGTRFASGYAIWVLQHCPNAASLVSWMKGCISPGGKFYIVNNIHAAIPTNQGWVNDGNDIRSILEKEFRLIEYSNLPPEASPEVLSRNSFIGKYLRV